MKAEKRTVGSVSKFVASFSVLSISFLSMSLLTLPSRLVLLPEPSTGITFELGRESSLFLW